MECCIMSSPEYSHIQLIIQKSTLSIPCTLWFLLLLTEFSSQLFVIKGYILVPGASFQSLHSIILDSFQISSDTARRKIYELGNPIKGMVVERILKDKSLVPTLVRQHLLFCVCSLNCCIRIPLLSALHHLALTYSLSSSWISCMSSNLECWSLFSDTWSEYSMLLTQA